VSLLNQTDLEIRPISVRAHELVFVRHVLEASEGIGFLIAKQGGEAFLVSPKSQVAALEAFIEDMKSEVGLVERPISDDDEVYDVAR
jgi:hypothetical protein